MIKTLSWLGLENNFFSSVKDICEQLSANIMPNDEDWALALWDCKGYEVIHFYPSVEYYIGDPS